SAHGSLGNPGAQTGVTAIAHRAAMLPLADTRDGTVYLVLDPMRVVEHRRRLDARNVTADIACELRFRGAGGRVRARPSPRQWRRCRTAASSATTQAAGRLKGTARPHARPGDHPCPVRHGRSVA